MGEGNETSRDVNGVYGVDGNMRRIEERILTLLVEILEHRRTVNMNVYCEAHRSLHKSINNQRELLIEAVILPHNNVHYRISRLTFVELVKFKWDQFDHPPGHVAL
ncbi:hypothetical protein TNCV_137371 [Trichonephila clavipes]|nr:hypothetical protein TNCV_137371 [Trichonephila clavipes]